MRDSPSGLNAILLWWEIARRLVISEKTVKSHVGNILSKLHLEDRTQAAVFAWREGLVQPPDD